jgi:Metallo-peptidase family M12B Reprolysin-like/GEVED domain/Secretion system C-terminal sorting domain/Fibronectin type III domain
MKKNLLLVAVLFVSATVGFAQSKSFWTKSSEPTLGSQSVQGRVATSTNQFFSLDFSSLQSEVSKAPDRELPTNKAELIVTFPDPEGNLNRFRVIEASTFEPELAAKYPTIKSYAGQGIDDPSATIRFCVSDQEGFHGMVLSDKKNHTYYIDPITQDKKNYSVYSRESLASKEFNFECSTIETMRKDQKAQTISNGRTDDKKLRKYRLALSCTAEYGNIFAGTGTDVQKRANILAQMNVALTRVNGIYEKDLAITMVLVPNNDILIYFGSTTSDPWSNEWNTKTQQVTDAAIGSANYDIGHNFNNTGGGNAGCIGCVCTAGSKGSGYTGLPNPVGDAFYVDYVAHEMGHQFGGYHTQSSSSCRSGNGTTEVEPGSGSTIMGYAGVPGCTPFVQTNSDAYFHYVNIRDISANVQTGASSGCAQIINITNNAPTANAGLDYTIPKSTAFVLKGQGSDPDGDALVYTWEQNDPGNPNSTAGPSPTRTVGPMFRSRQGTSSSNRFLPQISDVVANNLAPTWEVIPSVARTLNFALTVRDNKAGGGQTSDDLMRVTVNGTAGPFVISTPNTAVSWSGGSTQTVTWGVASTNIAPVNCLNVNILLSIDGGFTYPTTLVANTPNDGSQAITVPSISTTSARIKVEAADNIFYDISNVNFTISGTVTCTTTVPTGLATSSITATGATLTWAAVSNATYDVQYRPTGTTTWTTVVAASNSISLSGLTAATNYEAQVRSKCSSGTTSAFSASATFTTSSVVVTYCASKGNIVTDEFIGRVQLGTINNASGAASGYTNYTAISTNLVVGSSNTMTVTPTWTSTVYGEAYSAWIDYNKDGDFLDAGELIWSNAVTTASTISKTFTVPAIAPLGATRLRVTLKYNALPTSCETFQYGEVEDYTVNITSTVAKATGRDIATQVVSSENRLTYPNPVKDYLFLALDENTVVHSVNVVTLSGATLHYIEKNVRQVNVSEIPSGMYIVSVRTDSGIAHEKFIKE